MITQHLREKFKLGDNEYALAASVARYESWTGRLSVTQHHVCYEGFLAAVGCFDFEIRAEESNPLVVVSV